MLGSIIVFIILVVLCLVAYFYKYGLPIVDWFLILAYLIPSSVLFCIHLIITLFGRMNTNEVNDSVWRVKNDLSNEYKDEINQTKGFNQDIQKSIKSMDDDKQKMMTDIDKQLKDMNTSLTDKINKRMDIIDINLNNKLDTTIANSRLNDLISKMDEYNQNIKTILDFNHNIIGNWMNNMETLWKSSMTTAIEKMELSKTARKELADELNALKLKLSQSRGLEYKQTLERYNKLKAKLSEMKQ